MERIRICSRPDIYYKIGWAAFVSGDERYVFTRKEIADLLANGDLEWAAAFQDLDELTGNNLIELVEVHTLADIAATICDQVAKGGADLASIAKGLRDHQRRDPEAQHSIQVTRLYEAREDGYYHLITNKQVADLDVAIALTEEQGGVFQASRQLSIETTDRLRVPVPYTHAFIAEAEWGRLVRYIAFAAAQENAWYSTIIQNLIADVQKLHAIAMKSYMYEKETGNV